MNSRELMNSQNNYIEKDSTNIIKGISLILMFIHHFFTFPDWYIEGVSYPYLTKFCHLTKICVPVFAFLTGYFYFYCKTKTLKYSIKKITDVWFTYIICFFVLLIPAVCLGVYNFSAKDFILELFALIRPTMCFCWYVVFYVTAMLLLPLYAKISESAPAIIFLVSLSLPTIILSLLYHIVPEKLQFLLQIIENLCWFSIIEIGFLFAKYGLFYQIKRLSKFKSKLISLICGFVCILFALIARYLHCSDCVCVPFFIFGIAEIYTNTNHKFIYKPLYIIGKYSLIMWFLHCVFFNQCKEYTQPFLFFLKNPILVTIFGLLVCLFISILIQIPINYLLQIKNRLLKI